MAIPVTAGEQPFSAEDAWVYPFNAGAPGVGKDIPGFLGLTSDPQSTTVERRGDNQVISKGTTLDSVDLTLTVGIWNLDALSSLVGGTYTATQGSTPNQLRSLAHKTTDQPDDFAIKAQTRSKSADGGALRFTFFRCQSQGLPDYGMTDQEYQDLTISASALPNPVAGANLNAIVEVRHMETYGVLTSTF